MIEVKGKNRNYTVLLATQMPDSYLIDEKQRTLLIRRSWLRPWRMLEALVSAMNDIAKRDDAWATAADTRPEFLGERRIVLGGEVWTLLTCSMLLVEGGQAREGSLRTVAVDWDARQIRVCNRFNLGFGAFTLAEAVAEIVHDRTTGILDAIGEGLISCRPMSADRMVVDQKQGEPVEHRVTPAAPAAAA